MSKTTGRPRRTDRNPMPNRKAPKPKAKPKTPPQPRDVGKELERYALMLAIMQLTNEQIRKATT